MCGITGFINKKWSRFHLEEITDKLAHRGPDAKGYFFDEANSIGLGHRRLSILDLSPAGNQPFYSRDGRFVMVYNGEVYNYKEVAAKYEILPRTSSDSEIIIEAFAKAGIDSMNDLNGMFAIAIWDRQDEKLYLIRDRIGIKPIYYYHQQNQFVFASELKAIFTLPLKKEINQDSVFNFLHLGYIPGGETIYLDCKKLKPGHYALFSENELQIKPYWQLERKLSNTVLKDETEARKKLRDLVQSSVTYCMISDVPLGIFLSGGVDSSLVAAVAQSQSALPVKTFSIAFKDEKFNEAKYARQVADSIQSEHYEYMVTENEAIKLTDELLDVYDEPYADSSAIPTMMLSRLTRQEVTVALSGDGGDELFMGYGFYYWARRLNNPLIAAFRKPIGRLLQVSGNDRLTRASTLFQYPDLKRKSHIFSQEQYYFSEIEIQELLKKPVRASMEELLDYDDRNLSWPEQQSFFDIKNYLPEELLVKTDRASMRYSLEVRVPLLDHRLVEFAINLSQDLKLKGNTGKYLLKKVLYEYLPASIFERPKKGFSVPLANWLLTDLNYLLEKYLCKQVIEECNLVNGDKVAALISGFLAGKHYLYNRLWALIILHKWFKEKHS